MAGRSLLPDAVARYVEDMTRAQTAAQARLRAETAKLPQAGMQIGSDQAALLAMLVRLTGARRAIEVGTFTGYSALAIAGALPADGTLICCDVSAEWTAIARCAWAEAGLAGKIALRLAPAQETIAALLRDGAAGSFDFAFIDADKTAYDAYYEGCLKLLRPGGLMAIDNVLWSGAVADPQARDGHTEALRALNLKVRDDPRVDSSLLTVGDGVQLARKRG
ncbi:MAG: class I SAM-dependent methyltransferase [Alphaproteobacteria bacterium]|nr:class I SAM-dependent methyltransferase [Alphaproteobacteria bacterium]